MIFRIEIERRTEIRRCPQACILQQQLVPALDMPKYQLRLQRFASGQILSALGIEPYRLIKLRECFFQALMVMQLHPTIKSLPRIFQVLSRGNAVDPSN